MISPVERASAVQPCDHQLGDVAVLRLAEILEAEQPNLPVVLATRYSNDIVEGGNGGRQVISEALPLGHAVGGAVIRTTFVELGRAL